MSECEQSNSVFNGEKRPLKQKITKKRQTIRKELSKMSYEDLQKLKVEMGTKLHNKTNSHNNEMEMVKTSFKRANKNRPRTMSSKKAISLDGPMITVKKQIARDPRFESMCGIFDRNTFKTNYKFVSDLRKREKRHLEDVLHNTDDKEEKRKITFIIQRLENQICEDQKGEKQAGQDYREKQETNIHIEPSGKPQLKKKSVKKLESLISKFEELKKTNRIQKHIERKSKKVAVKERKKLERQKLV